jgi:hypothetical protein
MTMSPVLIPNDIKELACPRRFGIGSKLAVIIYYTTAIPSKSTFNSLWVDVDHADFPGTNTPVVRRSVLEINDGPVPDDSACGKPGHWPLLVIRLPAPGSSNSNYSYLASAAPNLIASSYRCG